MSSSSRALFEVKVALLGPIASGKTTVLNSLLGDHYGYVRGDTNQDTPSEQQQPRTTTAVHQYRICTPQTEDAANIANLDSLEESEENISNYYPRSNVSSVAAPGASGASGASGAERDHRLQQNLLLQSAAARTTNTSNNKSSSSTIQVIHQDVPLEQDIFDMRPDTQLVLVDIPGLEFTSTATATTTASDPYIDYVEEHWNSFDCLMIVLDVTSRNNTQQQLLLQFIQANLERQNRLPVLCLWNKLDDPFDPTHLDIIQKTQQLVTSMLLSPEPTNTGYRNNMSRMKNKRQNTDNSTPVPFKLFDASEPYRFGPPMTEHDIHKHAERVAASVSPEEFTTLDNNNASDNNIKEPGEGYVVVAKPPPTETTHKQKQETSSEDPTKALLPNNNNNDDDDDDEPPLLFLPLSAKIALVHQRVCQPDMTLEQFSSWMEHDFIVERLGRELIGLRRWNQLSRDTQIAETFQMLRDQDEFSRALESCGYTAFETALSQLVGNQQGAQTSILEQQMESSLQALLLRGHLSTTSISSSPSSPSPSSVLLAPQMYSVYTKFQVLYGATNASTTSLPTELQSAFWAAYETIKVSALKTVVEEGPNYVSALAEPLEQLLSFHSISKLLAWHEGTTAVLKQTKQLVLQYLQLLLEQESTYQYQDWGAVFHHATTKASNSNNNNNNSANPWNALSPKDWVQIWSALLLLSYDRHFCQQFAREKLLMEELMNKARTAWNSYGNMALRICPHCGSALHGIRNEWRCEPCQFAFFTCYPSTACPGCHSYRFDNNNDNIIGMSTGGEQQQLQNHVCPANGYTYSTQQDLQVWMRTFYDRSQQLVPVFPNVYYQVVQTGMIPESLGDPKHIGHAVYQYCRLMDLVESR